ncbi:hypothetical protein BT93_L5011 [Corymbia citriodora subsp. variegata]|uniref:Uncharacterized protein n=1 Tax=Corymbia citriodora subsp. variegata TaxID=360336 RepID=A0A8T0CT52_CORYI|nr:hypothetical protein BT93_L5011 [Corymbia citriodora subsp. variegata]
MPLFSGFSFLVLPMGFNHFLHVTSVFQQFDPHSGYLLLLKASTSYSLSRFLYVWAAAIVGAFFFASK